MIELTTRYGIGTTVSLPYEQAVARTKEALAAERVGPAGRVYAVDVAPEMIEVLRDRGLPPQVHAALSEENRFPIPDAAGAYRRVSTTPASLANPSRCGLAP